MTMIVPTSVTATAITTQTPVWEKKRLHSRRRFSSPRPLRASVDASFDDRRNNGQRKQPPQPSWHRNLFSNTKSTIIAPVAVVSGTAYVYAAVVRHPSSTLTPLSVLYMLLLALQYAVQPRLAKRFIRPQHSSARVALAEESVKTVLAVGIVAFRLLLQSSSSSGHHHSFANHPLVASWTWQSSLAMAGLPAILYALQGVLQYRAYQTLDAVTYNGLSQGKTLSAALACWILLGTRQSPLQMLSLGLLLTATLLFQRLSSSVPASPSKKGKGANHDPPYYSKRFMRGVLPCVAATALSGVAGALSQKGLQATGQSTLLHRDPYVFTVEVSLYSALVLSLSRMWTTWRSRQEKSVVQSPQAPESRWTWHVWIPIVSKACGGILTALVHQTAGTVQKGFALVLGLVFARLWQQQQQSSLQSVDNPTAAVAAAQRREQGWGSTVATLLVLVSSWLHFTNPAA